MTLEGAIKLSEANDYIVYTMNSVTTGQYGVVVPKNITGTLNMLVDLHMKSSFDSVVNGSKTKEQLVSEISDEYTKLRSKFSDGMLVIPMIDEVSYQSIVNNGDKQKMFDEVKKIGAITSELYKKLTEQGIEKQKIDQKIIIVEKSVEDEKFVNWLKEQSNMANFVDGFKFSELNPVQDVVNPFMSSDSLFGPAPTSVAPVQQVVATTPVVEQSVSVSTNNSGIFESPVAQVTPVMPAVEPVVISAPIMQEQVSVMPEATPVIPVASATSGVEPIVDSTSNIGVNLFSNTTLEQNASIASVPVQNVSVQPSPTPVSVVQQPVVEGPKPVDATMLEGTMTFTPVQDQPSNQVDSTTSVNQEVVKNTKNNKGFANLLIIVVILIGVTIASIELGKYLYSVYGA